jgi:3-methylfumaryl-CoA hydratase
VSTSLESWIGRSEEAEDVITAQPVAAMSATLDRDDPAPAAGDPLPALWHWMYFTPKVRRSHLGPDGHPARGGFLPPVPLPRRMYAGGRLVFHAPLRVGTGARRVSEILDVAEKHGRSGPLVFVTVRHAYHADGGLALEEEQDLVYRGEAKAAGDAPPPGNDAVAGPWRRRIEPDPVTLFRYSALTFNGHRIHYDRPYATGVEGYPGLVVHGPLIATWLVELCRAYADDRALAHFRFRAQCPLFDTAPFDVTGGLEADGAGFWAAALTPEGAVAMEAAGTFSD